MYVKDAARACVAVAEALLADPAPRVEEHTFHSGWLVSDRDVAAAVRDVFAGRGLPTPPAPENPLGWAPAVGPGDALGETIGWYRDFLRTRFFGTRPAAPLRAAA